MRLICGLLRLDGRPAEAAPLAAMAAAMTAPGLSPALDVRLDGPMGLGALDFGGARGAVVARDGWIVAADARLDRAEGEAAPAAVAAVQAHGADFPDRLDGDFAVALWHPARRELVLGRDFIGVRPLAWTWRDGAYLAFASLPKGLHGSGLAALDLDPVALGCQRMQSYFGGADSGFAAIAYLEAGHSLTVRPDARTPPRPHRAYRPDPAAVGRWRGTPAEAAATLRRLVEEAVAARLPGTGPVACHLSGGLDSSAITVLAARAMRRRGGRVRTLTATAADGEGPQELDERPLIAAVLAQEPDLDPVTVPMAPLLPDAPQDPDFPGGPLAGHEDRLAAAAAAFGADRILSGAGGDEGATYNGANLYLRLLREGEVAALVREIPARARRDGETLWRTVLGRLIRPLVPRPVERLIRRMRGRPRAVDSHGGRDRYLNPALRDAVARRRLPPVLVSNSPRERVRALADHHIPSRCTSFAIVAARHGLAVSFPLLDRRVVDFMLSLPTRCFLAEGQGRQPFRTAMRGVLPDEVRLARLKVGLLANPLAHFAPLKPALVAALARLRADPSPTAAAVFDLEAIGAALARLPEPEEARRLMRSGQAPPEAPRWQIATAVQSLAVAAHLARMDAARERRPAQAAAAPAE